MNSSVLDTIGNTPIVRLQRLAPAGVELYVKLESHNPGGSVKDRLALAAIEDAETSGMLKPGQCVIEATSGNTGISLAVVCAAKGYPLIVVMAENFSLERRRLLRFLGARVVLTPAAFKGSGMVAKARELAAHLGGFLVEQFANPANARAHERTTAREILEAFSERPLDYFVTGAGTGGTLRGVARVLRKESPMTRIVVCEPDNAPVLRSGRGQPNDGSSHPDFRPHLMQGWTPDFISELTAAAVADHGFDRVVPVAGNDALKWARALARQEGILAGISSGATLAGALSLAAEAPAGTSILAMLPDSAERYMSTALFEGIADAMDDEEWSLSRATPTARFDAPAVSPAPVAQMPDIDPASNAELDELLADPRRPVLMFALAWCEFCWSVRKLFNKAGIPHRVVELDAPEMQANERGSRLRQALTARTGMATIPQVFIGGKLVGGCSDTFAEFTNGKLIERIRETGVSIVFNPDIDPATMLPGWRHPSTSPTPAASR